MDDKFRHAIDLLSKNNIDGVYDEAIRVLKDAQQAAPDPELTDEDIAEINQRIAEAQRAAGAEVSVPEKAMGLSDAADILAGDILAFLDILAREGHPIQVANHRLEELGPLLSWWGQEGQPECRLCLASRLRKGP